MKYLIWYVPTEQVYYEGDSNAFIASGKVVGITACVDEDLDYQTNPATTFKLVLDEHPEGLISEMFVEGTPPRISLRKSN